MRRQVSAVRGNRTRCSSSTRGMLRYGSAGALPGGRIVVQGLSDVRKALSVIRRTLADIKRHVSEAAVVIAEITRLSGNVFYEVGYADAMSTPLLILAQTGTTLPFDIRGYRVVFYEGVIGGEIKLGQEQPTQLRA